MSTVTVDDIHNGKTFLDVLKDEGVSKKSFIDNYKKELKSKKEPTRIKIKGAVNASSLPKGCRIVATSGVIYHEKDGDSYGDGETLIEFKAEPNWEIRQRARIDMQKAAGIYPAEKNEFTGKDGGPLEMLYRAVEGKSGSLVNDPSKRG